MGIGVEPRSTGKTDAAVDRRAYPTPSPTTAKSEAAADGRPKPSFGDAVSDVVTEVRWAVKNNPSGPARDPHADYGNG